MPLPRAIVSFICFFFRTDLGKNITHRLRDHVSKLKKEWFVKTKRAAVADRTAQNATQNVTATFVKRNDSIRDCKT